MLNSYKKCATPLCKSESEIEKFQIDVKRVRGLSTNGKFYSNCTFCEYYDTYKVDGDTTPVVLKINFQYIQDDRINERNHTKIESIGRVGVTFKAMVDL